MCTIHTYSAKFYKKYQREINGQLIQDAVTNDDGISVVFLDGHNEKTNTIYRTMDIDNAITVIAMLMGEATKYARVFIHLRAATTSHVGVGFTHAFDDMNGVVYMHNGVIGNTSNLAVDSYNMVNWSNLAGNGLLTQLIARREYFANVFRIDTVNYRWSVTRMSSGVLHTDGRGNYSTRSYGPLTTLVPDRFTQSYTLPFLPKPKYGNYYGSASGYGGTTGAAYGYDRSTSWYDGKKWDWEAKEYVTEAEWERRRKARSDKWTSLYSEDGDGEVGDGGGKTLPSFVPVTDPTRQITQRSERGAVDTIIRRINEGTIATAQQLLDDGEIPDPIDTEVEVGGPTIEEMLDAEDGGYGETAPTVLGPPEESTVVTGSSSSCETPDPERGAGYDLQKYREWLRRHPRGA